MNNNYNEAYYASTPFFGGPADLSLGVRALQAARMKDALGGRAVIQNNRYSVFGRGWSLGGLERIYADPEGTVLRTDGTTRAGIYFPMPQPRQKNVNRLFGKSKTAKALSSLRVTSAMERNGYIYAADCDSNKIKRISPAGTVETLAGTGKKGFSGDGGSAKKAQLSCPSALYFDNNGELLVSDRGNHRIRKITKNGMIRTIAGNGIARISQSGIKAAEAGIGAPGALAQDKLNTVHFISGNRVMMIDPRGVLRILAAENEGYIRAKLNSPSHITYDEYDNLIVSDTGNNRIVKLMMQTREVRVIAGGARAKLRDGNEENLTFNITPVSKQEITAPLAYMQDRRTGQYLILEGTNEKTGSAVLCAVSPEGYFSRLKKPLDAKNIIISSSYGLLTVSPGIRSLSNGETEYVSPPGDRSKLIKLANGEYERLIPDGDVIRYDVSGFITSKQTPNGRMTSYVYGPGHRLEEIVLPTQDKYLFSYDNRGYVKTVTDPAGRTTNYNIDPDGRLISVVVPDSSQRNYQYNGSDLLVLETDEDGKATQYLYDSRGMVTGEIKPGGAQPVIDPLNAKQLVNDFAPGQGTPQNPAPMPRLGDLAAKYQTPEGRKFYSQTNELGQVARTEDEFGRVTGYENDGSGLLKAVNLPAGNARRMTHTVDGLLATLDSGAGYLTTMTYDPVFNKVSTVTDGRGNVTHYYYNTDGNLVRVVDAAGNETNLEYYPQGILKSSTNALNQKTQYEIDARGNISAVINPNNERTEYTRDAVGRVIKIKNPLGSETLYQFDSKNRITQEINPSGGVTRYVYSAAGDLQSVTDPKNQTTTFIYSDRHQMIAATNPLGKIEHYQYDNDGNMIKKITRNGAEINYTYDKAGNLTGKVTPEDSVNYWYDLNNNLKLMYNNDYGWDITYDSRDLPSRVVEGDSNSSGIIDYAYDQAGNKSMLVSLGFSINYNYSPTNVNTGIQTVRIRTSKNNDDPRAERIPPVIFKDGRSTIGSWVRTIDVLNRPQTETAFNGINVSYSYDPASRVQEILNKLPNNEVLSRFSYSHDANGNRIYKDMTSGRSDYTYDVQDQLTGATNPAEQYSYDAAGNRLTGSEQYDAANRLITDGVYNYTYDDNGNRTGQIKISSGEATEYIWTSEDRLREVKIKDVQGTILKRLVYSYDGTGRRVRREYFDTANPANNTNDRYRFDGNNVLYEVPSNTNIVKNFKFHEIGLDRPVAMIDDIDGDEYWSFGTELMTYTRDALGSISEITDPTGGVVQKYDYTAYGQTTITDGPAAPAGGFKSSSFMFTGREYEPLLGLYNYRARWFDPMASFFLSPDPIGFAGGDTNLYRYVWNNPLRFVDPLGLQVSACGVAGKVLQGVAGFGSLTVGLGVLSGEGGTIGGTPLNVGEEQELSKMRAEAFANELNENYGIVLPPIQSTLPLLDPYAGQPQIRPAR